MNHILRIGSRKSVLALRQAEMIAEQLKNKFPGLQTEILTRDTLGDQLLHSPLQAFGGKGAFVSEFEQALLEGSIDLAVHSAKDMPVSLPEGLVISALSEREDPGDVLILPKTALKTDKKELVIGTSSPRRQLQIREQWQSICGSTKWLDKESRPVCRTLRGNVQTRLKKLKEGACDGILLAAAGLKRLGIEEGEEWRFIRLSPEQFLPAGGQGILAVETKADTEAHRLCSQIDCRSSRLCLTAERAVLEMLQAGCHAPVAVYANLFEEDGETKLRLRGINGPEHASQLTDAELKNKIRRVDLCGTLSEISVTTLADQAGKGLLWP